MDIIKILGYTTDKHMQHVKVPWLRKFNYSLVGATVILFVTYVMFELLNMPQAARDEWGITPLILTIGAVHAIYVAVSHKFFINRNPWLAGLISIFIYSLLIISIMQASGNENIYYTALFALFVFFTGMLGLYAPLSAIIFSWFLLIFILTLPGIGTPTRDAIAFNTFMNVAVTITGFSGWLYFKKYYVTNKKETQLQNKLREEQFKTSAILESISDGVVIINTKGTVEILNQSTTDLLGWDRRDAEKLDYRSLIQPLSNDSGKTAETDAISECVKTNTSVQRVSLLKTHHDRQIYVDIVASPITQQVTNEDGSSFAQNVGVVAVLRDVDAQKRQEQQRSDFISTASHEMRTPVASIQGFLELALNEKVSTVDDKARGYLEKAYDATKHLGGLFQDLLTVSKSDDGRLVSHPELVDIAAFLKEIVEQQSTAASKKGLSLTFDQPESKGKSVRPLLYVHVDPERLHEVVGNLIENAIKYTSKGVITLGASVVDQGVVIRVSDTGAGIATEDIPHIFQKFYRTDNSVTREVGGTGLGLYISKQIVELMQGRIWVESALGSGSTFYVSIPRVSPSQVAAIKAKQAAQTPETKAL